MSPSYELLFAASASHGHILAASHTPERKWFRADETEVEHAERTRNTIETSQPLYCTHGESIE